VIFLLAKLGLSPHGDATQAVARTRDAVGPFPFFIIGMISPITSISRRFESGTPTPELLSHLCAFDTTAHRAILVIWGFHD